MAANGSTRRLGAKVLLCALLGLAAMAARAPAAGADVVLNEINCEGTDWVELVNTSNDPADISGWLLTDDPLGSTRTDHRMHFPASTVIGPLDDLVVEKGASGFPFGISCGSDTIRLADASESLVDGIAVPTLADSTDTWGRYPNGTGSWVETLSSKGAPNQPSSAGGGGGNQAAWMYDPSKVVEINLTLPQSSIDALNTDPEGDYQDGTFSLTTTGGSYGPLQVGVRLKGSLGSFRPLSGKAAFKIKFNHSVSGQRFLGLKKLTLNNMVQDHSMVHEVLAYTAFRAAGIPAPRTGYAYVRVNGSDYGLYLNLETPDDVFLPRWYASTQHLYDADQGADVKPGGAAGYQVDEGSESDVSDLEALIAAVNDPSGDYSDRVASVADLQEMTRMWAVEKYIGHWDSYSRGQTPLPASGSVPNNYFLHSDSSGLFTMMPWGADQTWVDRIPFAPIDGGLMFEKCLGDPSCHAMYRQAVIQVRSLIMGLGLDALADNTAAVLAPWEAMDPRREYSMDDIAAGVSGIHAFLAARPADVDAWLNPPPPTAGDSGVGDGSALAVAGASRPSAKERCKRVKRKRGAEAARKCRRKLR